MESYDLFSADYDRFVNWPARLEYEMPFIERLARSLPAPQRILDAACGTGRHVIALAMKGFLTAGADLSRGMIDQARKNAAKATMMLRFEAAGFGELRGLFHSYDLVLCLGNSLPHVLDREGLGRALSDFAACLRPGGKLLIQNRNFDAVMAAHERWMEPQSYREGESEWIFLRFYDYEPDGLINFNILTLRREGAGAWKQAVTSTRLRPLLQVELVSALDEAGFEQITSYGSMSGDKFDPAASGNLIITAQLSNVGI